MNSRFDMVLTRREREVAQLVTQGLTNRAIAERLYLSERTIEGHIEHAFNKLGLSSRTQLAMWVQASQQAEGAASGAAKFPTHMTSFIGREPDIAALHSLVAQHRIVTLIGAGGAGKTRLAIELVRELQFEGKTKAWFVDVSAIGDPALLAQSVATAIGVSGRGSPTDAIIHRLGTTTGLLILDNCEHLLQSCADLVTAIADQCPGLNFLLTSREPTRLAGEATWHVQPLSVPLEGARSEDVMEADSVKLFVERAKLTDPVFNIDGSNADAIGQVCRQLDGLPLAIELAASRVGLLSPSQMVAKLYDRFSFLGRITGSLPARQQTMKATLAWSYDLLSDPERSLLRRVSIFTGTFTLDAAEAVCGADPLAPRSVMGLLGLLIDKSLVNPTGVVRGEMRYRLLDSTRAFAAELLSAELEARLIAERHARLYASIALEAGRRFGGPDTSDWTDLVGEETDNLRAALLWAIASDKQLALGMCASLAGYWDFYGWLDEGRHWLALALEGEDRVASAARSAALAAAGMLAYRQAAYAEARRYFGSSLDIADALHDRALSARALAGLADVLVLTGDPDAAMTQYEESLELYRAENDLPSVARGLSRLAGVHNTRGDFQIAEDLCQESLALFRSLGDRVGIANQLFAIGAVRCFAKRFQSARTFLKESLAIRRELGDAVGIAWSSKWLAYAEIQLGDLQAACQPLEDGLNGCMDAGDLRGFSIALDMALGLLLAAGFASAGIRVESAAKSIRNAGGFESMPWLPATVDGWYGRALAAVDLDEAEQEHILGRSMTPEEVLLFTIEHIHAVGFRTREGSHPRLTRREHQVAELVAQGLTNREIAQRMHISEQTADSHVQHAMAKLGFRSRAQIAAWQVRNGTPDSDLVTRRARNGRHRA